MEAVFDGPVIADERADQAGDAPQRGNVEAGLALDLVAGFAGALNHDDGVEGGPPVVLLKPLDVVDDGDVPGFDASVIAIGRWRLTVVSWKDLDFCSVAKSSTSSRRVP
jgi:hypothetical protein